MIREYSYDELAGILGCSRTAIAKKIKPDENNPGVERYKNRFEVVIKDGKKCILLDDADLEEEKLKSRGFKNVANNGYTTPQSEDIIDVEAIYQDKRQETLLEFTERYIDKFTTLQETMYNELRNRDNQILLLTTSEKSKQEEHFKTEAENKALKQKYNVMRNVVITLATLLVILTTFSITFFITERNVSANVSNVEPVIEETSAEENIIIPDTKKAVTGNNRRPQNNNP